MRLSFDGKYNEPGDIERNILNQLAIIEHRAGLDKVPAASTGPERLQNVLYHLRCATGRQVVVLVDEYDKPILDMLHDPELATANRDYLRGFYGIVKGSAEHVRFVFVTGVSMFSKVSLFSGLNNLKDISLDPRFATICGYREEDLDRVFGPELAGLDREKVRTWYNGYHWRGGERVYNPYDVLLLLDSREFRPYWFGTGSPDFLFRTLMEKSVSPMELEGRLADMSLVSKFDVGDIDIEALLFQTGYLTIAEEEQDDFDALYRLDYPNLEVRISLNRGLLAWLGKKGAAGEGAGTLRAAGGERLRGLRRETPRLARGHSLPVACQGRPGALRGLVCEPSLHVPALCRGGPRRGGGLASRPCGHGGASRRAGLRAGVQDGRRRGGRRRRAGCGDGADARAGLCGDLARPQRPGPPDRRGLRGAQPSRYPRRGRVTQVGTFCVS